MSSGRLFFFGINESASVTTSKKRKKSSRISCQPIRQYRKAFRWNLLLSDTFRRSTVSNSRRMYPPTVLLFRVLIKCSASHSIVNMIIDRTATKNVPPSSTSLLWLARLAVCSSLVVKIFGFSIFPLLALRTSVLAHFNLFLLLHTALMFADTK